MRRLTQASFAALVMAFASAAPAPAHAFIDQIFGALLGGPQQQQQYPQQHASLQPMVLHQGGYEANTTSRIPREVISYAGPYAPGTVVVNTTERRLYLVMPGHRAMRYGIGVGKQGFQWAGMQKISRKQEWPDWTPPAEMLQRRPDLPRYMAGGPENPLGARALYLGSSLYRIHGSNEPDTIGHAVSSGCIRMLNEDVVDLYDRVQVGTAVVVLR
jgi:lipoprotein-anchoring transpeptidase ErfK/SrfK